MKPKFLVASSIMALLTGCASIPSHNIEKKPDAVSAFASREVLGDQHGAAQSISAADWSFGDPQLAEIYAKGLANAPRYAEALGRLRKADAIVGLQRATQLPQVDAEAGVYGAQQSQNVGIPTLFVPRGLHSNARLTLGAVWDADLFGRNRAALAATVSEAAAVRYDTEAARLMLLTSIAQSYGAFAQAVDDEASASAFATLRAHQYALYTARVRAGLESESAALPAETALKSAQATLAAAQNRQSIARYRLAALVGAGPDFGLSLAVPQLNLPARRLDKLGADVIASRPDVAAARAQIAAQAARVEMARRDFYPDISLSALAGFQSLDIADLLRGSSAIPSFGAALHLPLFAGGRLKAAYHAQQADYDGALAAYNGAVVGALEDVASSFKRLNTAEAQFAAAREIESVAAHNYAITRARLRAKLVSELPMTVAEASVLDAKAQVASARTQLILSTIDVMRALGGRSVSAMPGAEK